MQQTEWDGFRSPKERAGTLPNSSLPPPDPGAEEALLARALRQRDEAAFDGLLDRLHSPMLRLAQVFVRSREDAEEVVQDTWLAALGGIERFQGRSSLKTWLFRILVYRARTRGKREARTVPFSALSASAESGPDDFREDPQLGETPRAGTELFLSEAVHRTRKGPEVEFLAAELRRRIEDSIAGLPTRQREVITLRDLEGWSAEEVCELLDVSEANQRVLLHRARVRVRDAILPYLGADEAEDVSRPTCCVRVSDRPPQRPPVAGRRRSRPAPVRQSRAGRCRRGGRPDGSGVCAVWIGAGEGANRARGRFGEEPARSGHGRLRRPPVVKGVQQPRPHPGRDALPGQGRQVIDGPADLAEMPPARRARPEVRIELRFDLRWKRSLQVLRGPEHHLLASERLVHAARLPR